MEATGSGLTVNTIREEECHGCGCTVPSVPCGAPAPAAAANAAGPSWPKSSKFHPQSQCQWMARVHNLKEEKVAPLLNLASKPPKSSSAAGIKGGGKDVTFASRGSTRRRRHLQGIQQNPPNTSVPFSLNTPVLHSAIRRGARQELGDPAHHRGTSSPAQTLQTPRAFLGSSRRFRSSFRLFWAQIDRQF